jgi:D-xylose transport system permease protein
MSTMLNDPRLASDRPGLAGALAGYRRRIAQGDIGQLPVIIGLAVIWVIFYFASNGNFFKPVNLVNLSLQMASVGTIAVGVVFVLLLGEIDLTVGIVSGLAAGVLAVLNVRLGLPGPVAVVSALVAGALVGLIQGLWITRFGIPAFVVTLAGLIGWQGLLLYLLGDQGTINLRDDFVLGIAGTFFPLPVALVIGALFVAYLGWTAISSRRRRLEVGLPAETMLLIGLRVGMVAVFTLVALLVLNLDRGLPLSVVFLVGLIVVMDYVVRRTRFGRMVFAIGGNTEAARRAGFNVPLVRVAVFVIASTCAAWGGILAASRGLAVTQAAGAGPELVNAIAAAVIGGTSLFGGRGTVWAALVGILVIQSISNGMDLLSFTSPFKLMITGAVLLAAVTIDAIARRGQANTGK